MFDRRYPILYIFKTPELWKLFAADDHLNSARPNISGCFPIRQKVRQPAIEVRIVSHGDNTGKGEGVYLRSIAGVFRFQNL